MLCFPGERGTTRHGSTQNGIVGVQPYNLSFSNREYSSSSNPGGSPSGTNLVVPNRNSRSSSPSFELDMKRSHADDSQPQKSSTMASKIANTAAGCPDFEVAEASPKQCKFATAVNASVDLKSANNNRNPRRECEVFLGGSCNPTSWRIDIAIPMLKKAGITYFNPQVEDWHPDLIEKEHYAKDNASLLFFVIDNQTRGVAAMAEVAYLVASGKKVILVISGLKGPGQTIMDEPISQSEYEELTCGQLLLQDLAERHDIPVFNDINTALLCTAKVVHDQLRPQDLLQVASDLVRPALNTNTNVKIWVCSNLKKTFESLDSSQCGKISLSDVASVWKLLMNGKLGPEEVLNSLNKLWAGDKANSNDQDSSPSLEPSSNRDKKDHQNGNSNRNMLNYEDFCRVISELIICHRSTNRTRTRIPVPGIAQNTSSAEQCPNSPADSGRIPLTLPTSENQLSEFAVYLAGPDSDQDSWRNEIAIPLLSKHNLTYSDADPSSLTRKLLTRLDTKNCDNSRVLLFYLTESTRAVEFMIHLAYCIGLKRELVVCTENLKENCRIDTETLSCTAIKDYNRARSYVCDMAKRVGFSVFQDINEALDCVIEKCTADS